MNKTLEHIGNAAAIVGVLLCAAAGAFRGAGFFYIAGFEAMSLFIGGMGLMVGACLAKLHILSKSRS